MALKSIALRYFNAAGADPDGEIGEDHDPETHLIPLVLDAAAGAKSDCQRLRLRLRHARRDLRSRLHPRQRPRRRACAGAAVARGGRRVRRLQPRERATVFRCWKSSAPRSGRQICRSRPPSRRGGRAIRRRSWRTPRRPARRSAGRRARAGSMRSSRTAWAWRQKPAPSRRAKDDRLADVRHQRHLRLPLRRQPDRPRRAHRAPATTWPRAGRTGRGSGFGRRTRWRLAIAGLRIIDLSDAGAQPMANAGRHARRHVQRRNLQLSGVATRP